ncbi:MAG: 3-dehydroquinate synthase [Candidatus Omnitrophota bacterium]|jgi:3-dehydroquinate synthase
MKIIKVNLKKRSYKIIVGSGILKRLSREIRALKLGTDAFIITNKLIRTKFGKALESSLRASGITARFRIIPDTEKSKSVETASAVIKDLAGFDKARRVFIISFGGGVVGDLGGFVASIYKRGVPYIQIPTTLLAQVDSAIGGKTAIDLSAGKNLVGAFYQPRLVFSDTNFLQTLSSRQLKTGLAEVIKYGIIKDKELFSFLAKNYKSVLKKRQTYLEFIVERCSKIKADIVSKDEREERGFRTILNFGHTLGHAIETAGRYNSYNHGEAVAIGMLVAGDISVALGLTDSKTLGRIEKVIKETGLPITIEKIDSGNIISAHYKDKKFTGKRNRFVLCAGIGKVKVVDNIPFAIIKEALRNRINGP